MMKRFQTTLILGTLLALSLPLTAADLAGSKDNPYVKRFDGSTIIRYKTANYDTLYFIEKPGAPVVTKEEGKMVRVLYRIPAGVASSLEVFRNYENELKQDGYNLVRTGSALDIGEMPSYVISDSINQGAITPTIDKGLQNLYYAYGTKHDPQGDIHLSVSVSESNHDQNVGDQPLCKTGDIIVSVDSIQLKPVGNKMVDGNADEMSKQIAATGSINLYGIYFDTNKTEVKAESKPTLDEVGKLLANDTALKLKVVGHTDNVGTADYNNDLSLRRAQSVVQALVTTYSVEASRLIPFGAGFTKPVASNDTEDGRAKNRRVELVKL